MKQLPLLLAILLLSVAFTGSAQTAKISGKVQNSEKPIEAATVSLLRAKDSALVKFTATGRNGAFELEVKEGYYLLSVQAIGYAKKYTDKFQLSAGNSQQIGNIEITAINKQLEGVTVSSRKPLVEQKIDRMIVNVDASPTNVGSTAMDVLEKSPGISVDKDGNISLKGKDGVLVLIDGRPTQLSGADLANMLRNLNASQMDVIEIMTNPPAKYDAAGNAGVINIRTKKNKQYGYNGSVTVGYGQGAYPKLNESINLNYRKGKVNLFTNLSHNYRKGFGELNIQRNFINSVSKAIESHFEQQARMMNEGNSWNGKLGMDYFASKRTTLGVVFSGYSNPGTFQNVNVNDLYNPPGFMVEQTRALSKQKENWRNVSTNVNFRHLLDSTGKELTADLDYMRYDAAQHHFLTNSYYTPSGIEKGKADSLYGELPQIIDIYSAKMDYVHPLKKGARFEAGLKTSFVETDNNAAYDTLHSGVLMHDFNRSNYFIYKENINAAYVNLSGSLSKKWSAQLGLRLENTVAKGRQVTTNQNFDRNYTQLFPTAFVQYKLNEKNTFGLNYGRRIRRPNYESLNPFIEYLDKYTYQQGNPNLKPQFSHNVEFSHTYGGFLTTTLNYTRTTDIIQHVIEQIAEDTLTYVKNANIAKQEQYGIAVSAGFPVTKWWTSNIYINAFYNKFSGIVNGDFVTVEATTMMLNGSQQIKTSKKGSLEISGFFRTAGLEGVIRAKAMGVLNLGYSHQVMKGKGSLRFNVRDILYTQAFKASSKYGTVDAAFQESRDSRVFNIGFTYRFNKGKLKASQSRRNNGASEEAGRVGGGN